MVYITKSNLEKMLGEIIGNKNLENLTGSIYEDIQIHFFSSYEKKYLLALKELLTNTDQYIKEFYVPVKRPVYHSHLIFQPKKPRYHLSLDCDCLHSDYHNYYIPDEIVEKKLVAQYRIWFIGQFNIYQNRYDLWTIAHQRKWGFSYQGEVEFKNSGSHDLFIDENDSINDIKKNINGLIKAAGRFYYKSLKHTAILKQFSKLSFLGYRDATIYNNNTGFEDSVVKDIIKEHNIKFKIPLKRLLKEYYRLILNPELSIDQNILKQLGFVSCSQCTRKHNIKTNNCAA